jgi:hypothetical protein
LTIVLNAVPMTMIQNHLPQLSTKLELYKSAIAPTTAARTAGHFLPVLCRGCRRRTIDTNGRWYKSGDFGAQITHLRFALVHGRRCRRLSAHGRLLSAH